MEKTAPMENPSRAVQAVCAYWLTSSDGFSAQTGIAPSRRLIELIVMSASPAFIYGLATAKAENGENGNRRGACRPFRQLMYHSQRRAWQVLLIGFVSFSIITSSHHSVVR